MNTIKRIKDVIQDCNLNFLVGSGLSSPYLRTLGDIESLLTQLADRELATDHATYVRASLYKSYFDGAIAKNIQMLEADNDAKDVLLNYRNFIDLINSILLRRKSTILSKEANIFTTNVDVFLEKALEDVGVEYNDGFNGRFQPLFSLRNFKKSRSKRSLHYDNVAELPVFNLLKLHGSLAWQLVEDDNIAFSVGLADVKTIQDNNLPPGVLLDIADDATMDALLASSVGKTTSDSIDSFLGCYEKLLIVNPTKEKFKQTILNHTYYELLRMYSNELERENTVLFVMGFSFCDEHIRELTLRAANSNPTLAIYVIAHSSKAKAEIEARLCVSRITNRNIEFVAPTQEEKKGEDDFKYDLSAINSKVFATLFEPEEGFDFGSI